jgi:hypothetical protein
MQALSFDYRDTLEQLNKNVPLREKVRAIHRVLRGRLGGIDRIAAALYDPASDLIKTFVDSSGGADCPLRHHQARLGDSPSLREILRTGRPRVVNDLAALGAPRAGTRRG